MPVQLKFNVNPGLIPFFICIIVNIYIFIAIVLDESIFLDNLHFPMKNIKSRDLEATPMGRATLIVRLSLMRKTIIIS